MTYSEELIMSLRYIKILPVSLLLPMVDTQQVSPSC